ncbi:hypothetical protein B484DRAFT_447117 [Ochromonadaceae sp. CCMP2298]|nr:hypothetical protein B484DRAFT_447117 [Ochromonadaceae sp. CCMP2298]
MGCTLSSAAADLREGAAPPEAKTAVAVGQDDASSVEVTGHTIVETVAADLADVVEVTAVAVGVEDEASSSQAPHEPLYTPEVPGCGPSPEVICIAQGEDVPPPLKKGFLPKQGHFAKNWRTRFFVLEAGSLKYYTASTALPPYGVQFRGQMSMVGVKMTTGQTVVTLDFEGNAAAFRLLLNKIASPTGRESQAKVSSSKGLQKQLLLDMRYPSERIEWIAALNAHIIYANDNI